jgi:hypothetical protein
MFFFFQDAGDDSSKSRLKQEIDRLKNENESLKVNNLSNSFLFDLIVI